MGTNSNSGFIVIDDDPINNLLCTKFIRAVFPEADIKTFTSPVSGLEYINSMQHSELIGKRTLLLDINMPFMSGWEFLEKMSDLPQSLTDHLTVYILSSSIAILDKSQADSYPMVAGFIEKPLTIKRLKTLSLPV